MAIYIGSTAISNAYIGIPSPESIVLDKSSISLTTIGQTEQLTATIEPTVSDKTITWSSDDTTVATVSTTGLVTCVTPGTCTITATTVNGLTATCSVWQGRLPAEYQEVEYIQSSGTQYMTTSIIPSDTKGIYIKLSSQDVNNDLIYVGSRNSTDTRFRIGNSGYSLYIGWNTNDFYNNISTNTIYEVKLNYLNSRKKECNGTTVSSSIGTLSSSNTYPIGIFAGNERGSIITPSKIKLYFCKISDGSNIAYDFVPCYRKLDGVIGLYETVNKVFYTNSGTGTFTKGNDV